MTQSKPLVSAYIANFRLVDVGLFAGAQPQIPAGIAELQDSYQVKTIIDLRGEDELETQEGLACTERGITHYSIPLPSTEMLEGCVPRDKVMHVLALIEDPANWPLFWHCRRGQDRSSMICQPFKHDRAHRSALATTHHPASRASFPGCDRSQVLDNCPSTIMLLWYSGISHAAFSLLESGLVRVGGLLITSCRLQR